MTERPSGLRLLNVAALAEKKGHRFLIEAMAELPEATLEIVGDGELRADLEAQVRGLGLEDRVTFLGEQPKREVARLMREAGLFVLPSLAENLPVVLIEAMASGLPSVATRVGGVPEMLGDGDGELVQPGDAAALAAAVRTAAGRSFDPQDMAARARARYSYAAVCARWSEIYDGPAQQAGQQLAGHQPPNRLVRVGLEQGAGAPGVGVALGRVQVPARRPAPAPARRRCARSRPAPGASSRASGSAALPPGAGAHTNGVPAASASIWARPQSSIRAALRYAPAPATRASQRGRSTAPSQRTPGGSVTAELGQPPPPLVRSQPTDPHPPVARARPLPGGAQHVEAALVRVARVRQHRRRVVRRGRRLDRRRQDQHVTRGTGVLVAPGQRQIGRGQHGALASPLPGAAVPWPVDRRQAVEADRGAAPRGLEQRRGDGGVDDRPGDDAAGRPPGRQRLDQVGGGHGAPQHGGAAQRHRDHPAGGARLAYVARKRVVGVAPTHRRARRDERDVRRSGHGQSVGSGRCAGSSRPVALITGTISPYRREPFRLLGQELGIEVLAFEDTGPPIEGLVTRRVSQGEAVRLVASGRYAAVVCGLGGRLALPGSYAAARVRRIPFVLWATIWEHPRTAAHRLSWLPTRHLYRHADAVATYGDHVSRYVQRHRGARGSVFVAPQAVDVEHFAAPVADQERAAARERAGAGPGDDLFLFVGRLEPEKGVDVLLDAWRDAGLEGARLAFAGQGPLAAKTASQGPTVRSLGYVAAAQLPALYAAADALVLPSVNTATFKEPWGLVANEAMLQHTPVIASDAVGAAAGGLVADGRTGLVFPAPTAPRSPTASQRLATNVQERRRRWVSGPEPPPWSWIRRPGLAVCEPLSNPR